MIIRRLEAADSIGELTALLHAAYAILGQLGFNYTAVDQSEAVTRDRIARGDCIVATDADRLIGTLTFMAPGRCWPGTPLYQRPDVAVLGQFGVHPDYQRRGVGLLLLRESEQMAERWGASELALDTSEGADHLIDWYRRQGYRIVEQAQWENKTYRSVIMSKYLGDRELRPKARQNS